MRLNIRLQILIASVAFVLVNTGTRALAIGGQDGGGGGVIRCEKGDGAPAFSMKIVDGKRVFYKLPNRSALPNNREFELIDLWEAENGTGPFLNHKIRITFDNKTAKAALIERALSRLAAVDPDTATEVRSYHQFIVAHSFAAPAGNYILPPEDTDIRFLPVGCIPRGLGLYSDRQDKLVFDPLIMAQLPTLDQAAFELHEGLYKFLRVHDGAQDSWQTRRIIALIFSNELLTQEELKKDFNWQ